MKRLLELAATAALCVGLLPAPAKAYSALYVFGDSLSDIGNDYIGTVGVEPASPYYAGRFSNGPIWVDILAQGLGLGTLTPSLIGGTDFAFGGATTGYAPTSPPSLIPTLTAQVTSFLTSVGHAAPSSALYAVWIGSNDLFNIIDSQTQTAQAIQAAQGAAQTEATEIADLAANGARNLLVPLVTDLGKTPTLTLSGNPLAPAAGTALAQVYDAALETDLASLAATPGVQLSYLDTFSLVDDAVANPASFKLTNVTDPCYTGDYTGGGSACSSPDQYLFWDKLHPTAAVGRVIGLDALAALGLPATSVPEPGTLALLGAGLVGSAALRRRKTPVKR